MGNISAEQKLQMVQMIRAENQDNRIKMRSREKMLYSGETLPLYSKNYKEVYALEEPEPIADVPSVSSFKIRLGISILLFAAYLFLNTGAKEFGGITAADIQKQINHEVVFDFEDNFPYTLFSNSNK